MQLIGKPTNAWEINGKELLTLWPPNKLLNALNQEVEVYDALQLSVKLGKPNK